MSIYFEKNFLLHLWQISHLYLYHIEEHIIMHYQKFCENNHFFFRYFNGLFSVAENANICCHWRQFLFTYVLKYISFALQFRAIIVTNITSISCIIFALITYLNSLYAKYSLTHIILITLKYTIIFAMYEKM